MEGFNLFEANFLQNIQNVISHPLLDALFMGITRLGNYGGLFVGLALLLMLFPKTRYQGGVLALALLLELFVVNGIMKPFFARPRPFALLAELQPIITLPHDASFPSGHTAIAFAAAFAMKISHKRVFVTMVILACLMGLSRIYLAVHYPSDVLVGAIMGGLCGISSVWLWKKAGEYDKLK